MRAALDGYSKCRISPSSSSARLLTLRPASLPHTYATPGSEGGASSPIARFADIQDGIGCDVGERMRVLVTLLEA